MSIMELKPENHLKLEVAERPGSLHQKDVTLVYFYSHTLLIRAPFISHTIRTHFLITSSIIFYLQLLLFTIIACFTIRTHYNGYQAVPINEV